MEKVTKIKLVCAVEEREFVQEHAENLLRMRNNGGWHLPENSPYQFSEENGITKRTTNKGTDK